MSLTLRIDETIKRVRPDGWRGVQANRCQMNDEDPEDVLTSLLDKGQAIDEFWQRVKTNLQAGRVRLVFLGDSIPTELRRVVEFLNE